MSKAHQFLIIVEWYQIEIVKHNEYDVVSLDEDRMIVMKPAPKKIEKIVECLRIQPLRGRNLLYIT